MKNNHWIKRLFLVVFFVGTLSAFGQHSVARKWNEVLLEAIRNDYARPTVHARNLFHISAAMYDAWSVFEDGASPYLLGNTVHGFQSDFTGFESNAADMDELKEKAISYAAYRLLLHRFDESPGYSETMQLAEDLFTELNLDASITSSDFSGGSAEALGNYIAETYIAYGLQDGSNEDLDYANLSYEPENEFLNTTSPGNPNITDPNRWQPLGFDVFIDQSGNEIPGAIPDFLGPEWGQVSPFSLQQEDRTTYERDGFSYHVYNDPGPPPYIDPTSDAISEEYKWGFAMVAIWSSHLDPSLDVKIDISPGSIGDFDIDELPTDFADYDQFYDYLNGGDVSQGRNENPITGEPYEAQMIELGDYGRVLAEFWADGPDSETPPGHWFTILNYVSDHDEVVKKLGGVGATLSDLDWDIISYFILGGAMHDSAISAWGIKGYYDYIRPVSAIRYMADQGQSSDATLPNFSEAGIPLVNGYIELVEAGDPLVGAGNEHLNKIKLKAWKGPDYINDPETDVAGVDWILAENWWPYQRPTFITPPFAGYVSGHSTYSRAAAEVLTALTGTEYFPGGLGEFIAPQNDFLVFEEGPSEDIILQWATYRDASDQCSLSRIWGGIHPPADDLPGRRIGEKVGQEAFEFAMQYIDGTIVGLIERNPFECYPNPAREMLTIQFEEAIEGVIEIFDLAGNKLHETSIQSNRKQLDLGELKPAVYIVSVTTQDEILTRRIIKE